MAARMLLREVTCPTKSRLCDHVSLVQAVVPTHAVIVGPDRTLDRRPRCWRAAGAGHPPLVDTRRYGNELRFHFFKCRRNVCSG